MNQYAVTVARDALAGLNSGQLRPGLFYHQPLNLSSSESEDLSAGTLSLSEVTDKPCLVCAKGALLHGHLLNRPKDEPIRPITARMAELEEVFGDDWDAIEACFEGWTHRGTNQRTADNPARYAAVFPNKTNRLRAILENIIRNGGYFQLEQDLPHTDPVVAAVGV